MVVATGDVTRLGWYGGESTYAIAIFASPDYGQAGEHRGGF